MRFLQNIAKRLRADSAYPTVGTSMRARRWAPSPLGPNAALDYSADKLRAQSRDQVRKNALASSAVERITSNVIGTGIKPQLPDAASADLWLKWTDESAADGMLDFYGQQSQVMRAVVETGECFVRLRVRRPEDRMSVPLQLEIIESEFVPMDRNEQATAARGEIRQGVEFDRNVRSRRVAYWMHRRHPNDATPGAATGDELVRVPASEVLHIYLPGRPGQVRGEPWFARVLDRLKDLSEYDRAELVRKKIAAMFAGFIRRPTPDGVSIEDLEEIWGNADEQGGVAEISLEPGTMQMLAPGEDVEFSTPSDVGGQYEVFIRSQKRDIAAGLGILYEQLSGDYSQVNDRTWRAAINDFRRRCEGWQHHMIVFQFCRPVWRRWAELAVLSGALPATFDFAAPVKWTPQAWPYINPVQDVAARRDEVLAGFTSRSAVVSERGEDAARIDEEIAADNERSDRLGLRHASDARVAAGAAPAVDEDLDEKTGAASPADEKD